jgi:hypothetical protein
MEKEITKYVVDSDTELLFVGTYGTEEHYLDLDNFPKFYGLRPNIESELRQFARETDPADLGYEIPSWLEIYFDRDAWENDQEEEWKERHDVKATRENEKGETLYLGFGLSTDVFCDFKEHNIETYEDYCDHFDEIGLTEVQFNIIVQNKLNKEQMKKVLLSENPKKELCRIKFKI